jgi:hypothetical protein
MMRKKNKDTGQPLRKNVKESPATKKYRQIVGTGAEE